MEIVVERSRCCSKSGSLVRIVLILALLFCLLNFCLHWIFPPPCWTSFIREYLIFLSLTNSLDFLRKCRELSEWYGPSFYFVANPLMLPFPMHVPYENKTLDMAQKVKIAINSSCIVCWADHCFWRFWCLIVQNLSSQIHFWCLSHWFE